jgi:hypothetical protein
VIHPDLAAPTALAAAHEHSASGTVEVSLGEVECLADPQTGTPHRHHECPEARTVWSIACRAHDCDDLLDRRRISRVAEALVPGSSPLVVAGHRGWRAAMTSSIQQHRFHVLSSLQLNGPADRRARAAGPRGLERFFSYYNKRVEIHDSARKHGVADQDILHAIDHALAIEDAGEDPDRWLLIGPDAAGNLLEVVVLITAEGTQIVIHAMPMRDKYARLLDS